MIDTDLALQKILDALPSPDSTELDLDAALGHVLAGPAIAALDLPPFDQSAVDGYAVRHADIADAPLVLPVVQTIAAPAPGHHRARSVPGVPRYRHAAAASRR